MIKIKAKSLDDRGALGYLLGMTFGKVALLESCSRRRGLPRLSSINHSTP